MTPPLPPSSRRAAAGLAAASALALPAAGLMTTQASADPFAGGQTVAHHAIAGDGLRPAAAGSAVLTDGSGAQWHFDTNVVSATGDSASGAASDAAFATAIPASTSFTSTSTSGSSSTNTNTYTGSTTQTLHDAFNGYSSLAVFVGPDTSAPAAPINAVSPPAHVLLYRNSAEPASTCNGRELVYPDRTQDDVTVSRRVYVPTDAGYARWSNVVTNHGTTPTEVTLYLQGNLGSDSGTTVFDGGGADDWFGTAGNLLSPSGSTDPRIGHVIQGANARVPNSALDVQFVDGNDQVHWAYQVTLAPGQTRSLLNYALVRGFKSEVSTDAAALAAAAPTGCLTPDEASQVANFYSPDVSPPALSLPGPVSATATSAAGAVVTYAATATDAASGTTPTTCDPPSGSVFPVGTTTVTCTSTDASNNTVTGTFDVTVARSSQAGPSNGPVTGAADAAPRVSRMRVRPHHRLLGTKESVRFSLSEDSVVTVKVRKKHGGTKVVTRSLAAGRNKVSIAALFGGRTLPLGRYVVKVSAVDSAGQQSPIKTRKARVFHR